MKDRESYSIALEPGFIFAIEMALSPSRGSFLSRKERGEEKLDGGPGAGVADRPVMSQIALSPGKLIHQTVTSDSVQGHYGKRRPAPVGAFWSVSL